MFTVRQAITGIAALVLAGGITACGTTTMTVKPQAAATPTLSEQAQPIDTPTTEPPSTPDTFKLSIGDTVTVTDNDSGANWDVTLNSIHGFKQGEYDDPPHAGQHYIIIDVTYYATTGPVDVNEWDWKAKDPTGLVSDVQTVSSPNDLSATKIQTGSKIRGTVVLAIPKGSGGEIVYSAGMEENASWEFTAKQVAS